MPEMCVPIFAPIVREIFGIIDVDGFRTVLALVRKGLVFHDYTCVPMNLYHAPAAVS